jgi:hypothetical protein
VGIHVEKGAFTDATSSTELAKPARPLKCKYESGLLET